MSERGRVGIYAAGTAGLALSSQAVTSYLLYFYVDVLGLAVGAAVAVRTVATLIETATSPLWGHLSDQTRSPLGRRRPWLMAIGPVAAVLFALAFAPPARIPLLVWFTVVSVGLDVGHSILWTNQSALFPELFPDGPARVRAAAWRQGLMLLGFLVAIVPTPLVCRALGFGGMGVVYALAGAGVTGLAAFFLREPAVVVAVERVGLVSSLRGTLRHRSFWRQMPALALVQLAFVLVTATLPFYGKYALGLDEARQSLLAISVFGAIVPSLPVWVRAGRRAPTTSLYQLALGLIVVGLMVLGVAPGLGVAVLGAVVVGAGLGGVLIKGELILARLVDDAGRNGGRRSEGMLYAIQAFTTRVLCAGLVAPVLGLLDPLFGYGGREHPGAHPDQAFRFAMCWMPLAIVSIALLLLRRALRRDRSA